MGIPEHLRTLVPADKVRKYLLSFDHPVGRSKAAYFGSLGFRASHPEALEAALIEHARSGTLVEQERTVFGDRFVVEGPLQTPKGKAESIRSVWFDSGNGAALLVTAYPNRGPRAPRMTQP